MVHSDMLMTLAVAMVAAFIGGFIAMSLRLPAIVGYLAAGIAIGPFTPGGSANPAVASELAEVGVILLMFGVGIHFSLRDLLRVWRVAIPGAVGQIAVATSLGAGLALWWGRSLGEGLVLGLALSVASTVVLLQTLERRGELASERGTIALGWLIVEDIATVLALVLLPAVAGPLGGTSSGGNALLVLGEALVKAAAFVALMAFVGARVVPWLLTRVSQTGSRELFTLGVLATALGIAYGSAAWFGVSLALGAFLAGAVVAQSELSHRASEDALPLRDAFAVLFFVGVGMLFDPAILRAAPLQVLGVVTVIIVGKSVAALAIVMALGHPLRTGLTVAAGLAQIGEFSFILAELGGSIGLFSEQSRQVVLAGAMISITLNPMLFAATGWLDKRVRPPRPPSLAMNKPKGAV